MFFVSVQFLTIYCFRVLSIYTTHNVFHKLKCSLILHFLETFIIFNHIALIVASSSSLHTVNIRLLTSVYACRSTVGYQEPFTHFFKSWLLTGPQEDRSTGHFPGCQIGQSATVPNTDFIEN